MTKSPRPGVGQSERRPRSRSVFSSSRRRSSLLILPALLLPAPCSQTFHTDALLSRHCLPFSRQSRRPLSPPPRYPPRPPRYPTAMSAPGSGPPNGGTAKKPFPRVDLNGHDLPPSPAPSSPRNGRRYAVATELVYTEGNDQYNASSMPIYQVYLPSTSAFY
jgi:hypothetical protein